MPRRTDLWLDAKDLGLRVSKEFMQLIPPGGAADVALDFRLSPVHTSPGKPSPHVDLTWYDPATERWEETGLSWAFQGQTTLMPFDSLSPQERQELLRTAGDDARLQMWDYQNDKQLISLGGNLADVSMTEPHAQAAPAGLSGADAGAGGTNAGTGGSESAGQTSGASGHSGSAAAAGAGGGAVGTGDTGSGAASSS